MIYQGDRIQVIPEGVRLNGWSVGSQIIIIEVTEIVYQEYATWRISRPKYLSRQWSDHDIL